MAVFSNVILDYCEVSNLVVQYYKHNGALHVQSIFQKCRS